MLDITLGVGNIYISSYHSKAWELLLCFRGEANIQIGGDAGPTITITNGDLLLVPPGVAHKQLNEKNNFALLGSYPTTNFDGSIDTITGVPSDEERQRIANCYVPTHDPIFRLDIHHLCHMHL